MTRTRIPDVYMHTPLALALQLEVCQLTRSAARLRDRDGTSIPSQVSMAEVMGFSSSATVTQ